MSVPNALRFGIQSLDKLIGVIKPGLFGIDLSEASSNQPNNDDHTSAQPRTSSICLTGPDGTGKSVFSLHLASQYLADCIVATAKTKADDGMKACPRVLYISTDLSYKMAFKGWNHFGLHYPFERREPLVELKEGRLNKWSGGPQVRVDLRQYFPSAEGTSSQTIVYYLEAYEPTKDEDSITAGVCFVDLASRTAGDDWGFVHRLLSTLQQPGPNQPCHLLILDAVEGFETLVGELNAFGETSSRRSRIAQVMRLAAGKCHLLYVIEETREQRFPEEFVTDVVIRLRNVGTDRYLRRTVEIEKSRGQLHVRGQHPYVIRDGTGSTTGNQQNADDPAVRVASSAPFRADDFTDLGKLVEQLRVQKNAVTRQLRNGFNSQLNAAIEEAKTHSQINPELGESLAGELNRILKGSLLNSLAQGQRSAEIKTSPAGGNASIAMNRRILEDAYPDAIAKTYQSYIHIFPSLNRVSREIMHEKHNPRARPAKEKFAAFGITYLDNMLGGSGEKAEQDRDGDFDTRGLPCGSATALIGDSLTQKSQLGQAFLSRAFYSYARELAQRINEVSISAEARKLEQSLDEAMKASIDKDGIERIADQIAQFADQQRQALTVPNPSPRSVAVMFTAQVMNHRRLTAQFCDWLNEVESELGPNELLESDSDRNDIEESRSHGIEEFAEEVKRDVRRKIIRMARNRKRSTPSDKIYKNFKTRLREYLKKAVFWERLIAHIEAHTICRRFEIHDLPGPVLLHIFQRNIERAQRIMLDRCSDDQPLGTPEECYENSWRIRVVIDDLNSFRNIYPDVREDPLVLPSLLFNLGREGVTLLIVDTQSSSSPERSLTERFDSSVRELVQQRIYTWRLPFYGENRVAISLIPPISHEYRGVIRELRWETKGESKTDRALTVDPHFELYMNMEKGRPTPVPLQVRLYAQTPSFQKYVESEEALFREIFTPVHPLTNDKNPCVITPASVGEYDALRDSCHLQRDTRLDQTMIVQAGEFWWLRPAVERRAGAFRQQWNYLSAVTARKSKDKRFSTEPGADPFGIFQPPLPQQTLEPGAPDSARNNQDADNNASTINGKRSQFTECRRLNFFDNDCGYHFLRINEAWERGNAKAEEQYVDRVPFTWDFGFLLCNAKAWEQARSEGKEKISVGAIWDRLRKSNDEPGLSDSASAARAIKPLSDAAEADSGSASNDDRPTKPVSWSEFLQASKFVAELHSYRTSTASTAFDFTMLLPESFSCLILEMWISEVYHTLHERGLASETKALVGRMSKRRWYWDKDDIAPMTLLDALKEERQDSLDTILRARVNEEEPKGFSLELYKVWLLLIESIDFGRLVDSSSHLNFEFKSRDVSPHAVSARHWYHTASKFIDSLSPEQLEYNWIPARLPGHFSVRDDWFLAVAGGSRSSRLADHALDLLSSQRSNITRLQEGIGLPTRKLFDAYNDRSCLRTRLVSARQKEPLANVEYDALKRIGAGKNADAEQFYWLWRSGIWAYNRHSRIWHKWLNRTLLLWHSWRQRYGSNWTSGFALYQDLTDIEFKGANPDQMAKHNLESWEQFHQLRNILIGELERVSISPI